MHTAILALAAMTVAIGPPDRPVQRADHVIAKAIDAAGGLAALGQVRSATWTLKLSYHVDDVTFTGELQYFWQMPDHLRMELRLPVGDRLEKLLIVADGKHAWRWQAHSRGDPGKLEELDASQFKELADRIAIGPLTFLPNHLQDPSVRLLPALGESGQGDLVGIRVRIPGNPEFTLYYARKTGLLAKRQVEEPGPFVPFKQLIEESYSDFKRFDGILLPTKWTGRLHGAKFYLFEVTSAKLSARDLDAKLFTKPSFAVACDYSTPAAALETLLRAVRCNDLSAAKQCFIIDHDDNGGALNVIAGFWISRRRVSELAERKFGAAVADKVLVGWRDDSLSDEAIERTIERLKTADTTIRKDRATLTFNWQESDGIPCPVFLFSAGPLPFRKVAGNWKMDANAWTGLPRGFDCFTQGTWGRMFRDQMIIMDETGRAIERGELRTSSEFGQFVNKRIERMKKKYEDEERDGRAKTPEPRK
jgi:hypothetical protein